MIILMVEFKYKKDQRKNYIKSNTSNSIKIIDFIKNQN